MRFTGSGNAVDMPGRIHRSWRSATIPAPFSMDEGKVLQQVPPSADLHFCQLPIRCACLLHSQGCGFQPAAHVTAGFFLPHVNAALHVDRGSICIHHSVTKSMPMSWGARRQGKPASMPIAGFFFGAPENAGNAARPLRQPPASTRPGCDPAFSRCTRPRQPSSSIRPHFRSRRAG